MSGVDVQLIWPRLELDDPDMSLWHLPGLSTAKCVLAAFAKTENKNARAPLIRLSRTNFTPVPGDAGSRVQQRGSCCLLSLGPMTNAADPTKGPVPKRDSGFIWCLRDVSTGFALQVASMCSWATCTSRRRTPCPRKT